MLMAVSTPFLTLHSGAAGTEPNSREYLNLAAKVHPDFVEVDVRVTSDGAAVLHHDPFVLIKTEQNLIVEKSLKELLKIKPGLLTLGEAMDFCRGRKLSMNLDLKDPDALEAIFREAEPRDFHGEFVFSGCDPPQIRAINRRSPSYNALLSIQDKNLQDPGGSSMDYYSSMLDLSSELYIAGVNINHELCTPRMVEMARSANIPVAVWTVNGEADIRRCCELGIDSITTERPDLFRQITQRST